MNKGELLQKIKNEVAHKYGFSDWEQLVECDPDVDDYVDEIANLYAIAMCEEQKKQCHAAASIQSLPNTIFKAILETKNVAE